MKPYQVQPWARHQRRQPLHEFHRRGTMCVVPSTGATILPALRSGALRAIAVTAPQRMGDVFADVPIWKELGVNAVVASYRSLIGPRGMTAAHLAYWDGVLGRLTRTEDWKHNLDKNLWTANYMPSSEAKRDFAEQYAEMKSILADLGLVKPCP